MEAMDKLGEIYSAAGSYAAAEPYFAKALEIKRRQFGSDNLEVANHASRLALLYYCEGKYTAAEPLYLEALQIRKENLGPDDPAVLQTVQFYAALLRQEGRKNEARQFEALTSSRAIGPVSF